MNFKLLTSLQLMSETQLLNPPVRISRAIDNLVVFPWGGLTSARIQLVNTCPVDNWLMLFQALVKLRKVDLDELGESGQIIYDALKMIDENQYSNAKVSVLPNKPQVIYIIYFYTYILLWVRMSSYCIPQAFATFHEEQINNIMQFRKLSPAC